MLCVCINFVASYPSLNWLTNRLTVISNARSICYSNTIDRERLSTEARRLAHQQVEMINASQ